MDHYIAIRVVHPIFTYTPSISLGPAVGIHNLHLLDRLAGYFKQPWTGNHDCKIEPATPRYSGDFG